MMMTDDLVKRWDDYVESMGSVMGDVEHMAQQMRDRIEQLERELSISRMAQVVMDNTVAALTAERDEAYASGYNDAETEISKSALGQRNAFLNAEYANAAARIKDLNELLDEAQTEWSNYSSAWMTAEGKLADAENFIEHLLKLLAEAASDLTAYVDAEYPTDTCAQYPHIANRHYRDMELVRRIEAALTGKEPSHD
jgi:chromosome segregation ATPase